MAKKVEVWLKRQYDKIVTKIYIKLGRIIALNKKVIATAP